MENHEVAESVPQPFSPLPFPMRSFIGGAASQYRVFPETGRCVEVEAETAAEALTKSGVGKPRRILRVVPGTEVLIDRARLGG